MRARLREISTLVTDIAALTLWATYAYVRDERAGEQILPASIWASDGRSDYALERRLLGPYLLEGERGDGQKLLILSKGLFHSAEFAPTISGSSNESYLVGNF